jgi:hypothetical protein
MALTQVQSGMLNSDSQNYGFKNRIINGDMRIDQRNAGAEINPAVHNTYYVDRWSTFLDATSKYKIGQNAGSVTPPAGFSNYLGITSLSSLTTTTDERYAVRYKIEGYNVSDLAWGTASAAPVTLSFWARSSLAGTWGGSIQGGQTYVFSYTINSANTWEYKTITIPGSTSGSWGTGNSTGIVLWFDLGTNSSLATTPNSWGGTALRPTGAQSLVGTSGATWYVTGVQLEKGTVATEFDRRPYGTELQLCQRYFANIIIPGGQFGAVTGMNQTTTTSWFPVQIPFRATPTVTYSGGLNVIQGNSNSAVTSIAAAHYSQLGINIAVACSGASFTAGSATTLYALSTTSYLNMNAEL